MLVSFDKVFKSDPSSVQKALERVEEELIENKSCSMCKNVQSEPHYEMGYEAGADYYCGITGEFVNGKDGWHCLFWGIN